MVDIVDYIRLMIQKAAFEKIFDLDAKKKVFVIKIIDLNVELSAEKIMVALVFEIDSNYIYTKMALINEDIIVLF